MGDLIVYVQRENNINHEQQVVLPLRPPCKCQASAEMSGTTFLLHVTKEQRDLGESGTSTWRGRQGQARQGLKDHVIRVELYPKNKGKQE